MMPKMYVVSDVHGAFDEMIYALDKAGFDPADKNSWLISCGDEWDRFSKPVEIMRYFSGLERKILIRGNHMSLFEDLCMRGYPEWFDHSNGTLDTVKRIGCYDSTFEFDLCCEKALSRTKKYRDGLVNYFETANYIFTHSFIPLICMDNLPAHYTRNRKFEYNPDWRNASQEEWNTAQWGNPFDLIEKGLNKTGKTIIFGHWHCSAGWAKAEGRSEFGEDARFDPYFGDGFISLDSCVAHTNEINVLVLEDDFLKEE